MMEHRGDIFDTYAKYIAHGVNCDGLMGAGIAKTVKRLFPDNYESYRGACALGALQPGGFVANAAKMPNGRNVVVVNLASQDHPGPNADYKWLFSSLWSFCESASERDRMRRNGGIIAIPEIGCGIGGLEWPRVKRILKAVEDCFVDIEFEIWHYEG